MSAGAIGIGRAGPSPCQASVLLGWLAAVLMIGSHARADVFYLRNGGTVEGRLESIEAGVYRVRTTVGLVGLPIDAVERVVTALTIMDEYDLRVRDTPDTAADQALLGLWCAEQGLRNESRRHLLRAIELDPDHEAARRALGYVRAGDFWVDARASGPRRAPATQRRETEAERLARAIRNQWYPRIAAIQSARLHSTRPEWVAEGRDLILAIRDPLAIHPLAQVLGRGSVGDRLLLVEALAAFPEDEATMNLAALALADDDAEVRRAAVAQLAHRRDPRIIEQFRRALRVPSDTLVRRAAAALGELRADEAVSDLIACLTVQRYQWVEVPVRQWWLRFNRVFTGATVVVLGGGYQAALEPECGIYMPASFVHNEWQYRRVTVYRTEVLEALRRITGRDFGFDREDWQKWYEKQAGSTPGAG